MTHIWFSHIINVDVFQGSKKKVDITENRQTPSRSCETCTKGVVYIEKTWTLIHAQAKIRNRILGNTAEDNSTSLPIKTY